MSGEPAISVLVTAYNHAVYVEKALDSVAGQTFRDFELVITDDCSTDGSPEVIRSWLKRTGCPATFVANESNLGICTVRNRSLGRAGGRFVCSLAADDWYEPDRLERQHTFFRDLPDDVGFIYSDVRMCDEAGGELVPSMVEHWQRGRRVEGWIFDDLIRLNIVPAPGVMTRRAALDAVGEYDEALWAEDYDMSLRLAERFQVRYLPGVVSNYRVLRTSMSNSPGANAAVANYDVMVLLKWLGRDGATDRIIAERVRSAAQVIGLSDKRQARWALRQVASIDPREAWRARIRLAAPSSGRAAAKKARRLLRRRRS